MSSVYCALSTRKVFRHLKESPSIRFHLRSQTVHLVTSSIWVQDKKRGELVMWVSESLAPSHAPGSTPEIEWTSYKERITCICVTSYRDHNFGIVFVLHSSSMELNPSSPANTCTMIQTKFLHFMEPEVVFVFARKLHILLSWARWIQSTPIHHISQIPLTFHVLNLLSFSGVQDLPKNCRSPRTDVTFRTMLVLVWREVFSPSPKLKLGQYPLSDVLNCLLNVYAALLYVSKPSTPPATWGPVIPWWQGPAENGFYLIYEV
jgi:hypothetical protein